jgi:2-dehydropantoate 2-reductase
MSGGVGKLGRVAVVGAGAVGAYYGARLARAGEDVNFLMRSDLAAVRERGLTVRVADGDFHLSKVAAFGDPAQIGPVDLVIVGLKATANDALEKLLPPLLHATTAILTLQNGLGADEFIAARFGAGRVLGGLCFICLNRVGPGIVECYHPGLMNIGEFQRPAGERARAIAAVFLAAGVKCVVAENLDEARWRKLVWNVPFNGLSIAAGGITTDRILANPALAAEARALMSEIQAAARALGYHVPDEFLESQIAVTAAMGPYKPSSLVDFLERREVEVEAIWGEPLRRARAAGVGTPHLAALYEKLRELCAF